MIFSTIPSKLFVLGEYAVLLGLPSILVSIKPRFELSDGLESDESGTSKFKSAQLNLPEESPAMLMVRTLGKEASERLKDCFFRDPHQGKGGFGASTAQFALIYKFLAKQFEFGLSPQEVWTLYRKTIERGVRKGPLPSGADLICQWQGGAISFEISEVKNKPQIHVRSLWDLLPWEKFLFFSTSGRKTITHDHLANIRLDQLPRVKLKTYIQGAFDAIESNDLERFGGLMNRFADLLYTLGMEDAATHHDRLELQSVTGVLGVKGSGAMQSDAMIVLVASKTTVEEVVKKAEFLGLHWLPQVTTNNGMPTTAELGLSP